MARNTRQDRRARREKQGANEQSLTSRARARQQQIRPSSQPQKSQGGSKRGGERGSRRFVAESWAELKKVEWPGRSQVIQGTAVVLIACVIVGVFLFVNDLVWKRVVQNVLLGQ